MNNIRQKLLNVQRDLKAPKSQTNKFGGYSFRSCEDILENVKPHLSSNGLVLNLIDEVVQIGDRIYVKATARLSSVDSEETIEVCAFAREPEEKKGSDQSQITGAASSYARKYSCNGLFCIDDTKDADATNDHGKGTQEPPTTKAGPTLDQVLTAISAAADMEALLDTGKKIKGTEHASNPKVKEAYEARKSDLF